MKKDSRVGKKLFHVIYVPEQQLSLYGVPFNPPFAMYVLAYTYEAARFEAAKKLACACPQGWIIKSVSLAGL